MNSFTTVRFFFKFYTSMSRLNMLKHSPFNATDSHSLFFSFFLFLVYLLICLPADIPLSIIF